MLTATQQELVLKNRGLVHTTALKIWNRWPEARRFWTLDDLVAEGLLVMMEKMDRWDATRGKFSTFIVLCITRDLITMINHRGLITSPYVSRYRKNTREQWEKTHAISNKVTDEKAVQVKEDTSWVNEYVDIQTDRTKAILRSYFWEGKRQDQIAEELGCSSQNISRIVREACKRIGRAVQ